MRELSDMKKISVVIPVYNTASTLEAFACRLLKTLATLTRLRAMSMITTMIKLITTLKVKLNEPLLYALYPRVFIIIVEVNPV